MVRWLLSVLIVFIGGCKSSKPLSYDFEQIVQETQTNCEAGNYEVAIQDLEALEAYQQPQILELLAFTYESNKNEFKAAQTFAQASYADLNQSYVEDSLYAAQVYQQLNYNEAAACYYRRYIDHFPKDSEAWFALAAVEKKLEHWESALVAFLNGVSLKDKIKAQEAYQLAYLCKKSKLYEAAEFWLFQCLKTTHKPQKPLKQLLKLALIRKNRNKIKKLIPALEKHSPKFFDDEPWKSVREAYLPQIVLEPQTILKPSVEQVEKSLKWFDYPLYPDCNVATMTFVNFYANLPCYVCF